MFRPLSITRIYLNPLTLVHGEETEAYQCIRVRLGRLELPLFDKKREEKEKKPELDASFFPLLFKLSSNMFRPLYITRIHLNPLTLFHGEETEADQCICAKKERREKKNTSRTRLFFLFFFNLW